MCRTFDTAKAIAIGVVLATIVTGFRLVFGTRGFFRS